MFSLFEEEDEDYAYEMKKMMRTMHMR